MKNTRKILIITLTLLLILSSITLFACKDKKTVNEDSLIGTWQYMDDSQDVFVFKDSSTMIWRDGSTELTYTYNKSTGIITTSDNDILGVHTDETGRKYIQIENISGPKHYYKVED